MTQEKEISYVGKGQASRLSSQHEIAGGPLGIFGQEARKHDLNIGEVSELIHRGLIETYGKLEFRLRTSISKVEINSKLQNIDSRLGNVLFVNSASIRPDGGIMEVLDSNGNWRVILVGESKHQGNDVEKIMAGVKQGKNKDSDFMAAGNAIERVHKNILEIRNFMIDEMYFPYVVFLQGSNFATETFFVKRPDGSSVKVEHDSGMLNRIDRVTAANYSSEINENYCRNQSIQVNNQNMVLQIPSLFFQCEPWKSEDMYNSMLDIALTSISVLAENNEIKVD